MSKPMWRKDAKEMSADEVRAALTGVDDMAYFVYPVFARKLIGDYAFEELAASVGWQEKVMNPAVNTYSQLPIQHEGYDVYVYWSHPNEVNEPFVLCSRSALLANNVGNVPQPNPEDAENHD